jgi:pimeloyl-[acyl-carrier protein] methyl ester esterase
VSAVTAASGTTQVHVESAGMGPPLVLLHGWAMHGGLFAPILPTLAKRHRVHVVDLPGHGRSPALDSTGAGTLDAIVAAIDAALHEIRPESDAPLDVLGWSLGGAVAMRWALEQPSRIARLVLVATTPSFIARENWPHAMRDDTLRKFGDELRTAYRLTLNRFLTLQTQGSDDGRTALAALRHELFARGEPAPAGLAQSLALLRAIDLRPDAAAIRAPTLVVTGDRDTLAPREAAAWLANAIPDARLVDIPGAAHVPFLSHRDAFVAAVTSFLDGAPPPTYAR